LYGYFLLFLPLPLLFSSLLADIVFFIYLYQRWIYRVDPKRVNEYGTSGEDELRRGQGEPSGDKAVSANGPSTDGTITTDGEIKSPADKKND